MAKTIKRETLSTTFIKHERHCHQYQTMVNASVPKQKSTRLSQNYTKSTKLFQIPNNGEQLMYLTKTLSTTLPQIPNMANHTVQKQKVREAVPRHKQCLTMLFRKYQVRGTVTRKYAAGENMKYESL